MKTETAIAYAKRVYPNVTKTVQLQIASAYIAGATEGMRLTTEKFTKSDDTPEFLKEGWIPTDVIHHGCTGEKMEEVEELVEDKEYDKASSNAGVLL